MADISKIQLENDVYDIKDETARADIINTNNRINNLIIEEQTIRSLVTISDSYGVMDGISNFPIYMKNYLNLDNDHFYNNSYGGTGFAHASDDKTFLTLINDCLNNLTETRRNGVSHVLIAGGYNDQWSNDADIISGVQNCVTAAHNVFPNAIIFIAHIGWSRNGSDHEKTFRTYYEGTCLTKYGKFVINSQNILTGNLIGSDNVHPTNEGLQVLAKNLITGLQTGSCSPCSSFKYLDDENNNHLGVVRHNNNLISLENYFGEYSYTGTANGSTISFKTLKSDSMITGHHNCQFQLPCMFINETTYQYVPGYCNVKISQGVITLQPIALKSDGSNYFDFTKIGFQTTITYIEHLFS